MAKLDQIKLVSAITDEIASQCPEHPFTARQFNAIIDAVRSICREFEVDEIAEVDEIKAEAGMGIEAWRQTDQVGMSSDYMASVLGNAGTRLYSYPVDPSDFGRCLSLLEAAPELRDKLPLMKITGPEWKALVTHWDELETLYLKEAPSGKAPKLYDRMTELFEAVQS